MGKRRKARELVLKSLYSYEITSIEPNSIMSDLLSKSTLDSPSRLFASQLFQKVLENIKSIDNMIRECVRNWDINRLAIIDKNVIRMGISELLFFSDIPQKVSIDEAIELAKKYGSEDSGSFVNGVLDHIAKNLDKK
ncbi:MAG: transcription antitermination factor NusB [Candidatus Zixiibacteriota bacterium]